MATETLMGYCGPHRGWPIPETKTPDSLRPLTWVQGADCQVLSLEASDPFSWEKGLCGKYKQPKVTHTLPFVTSH